MGHKKRSNKQTYTLLGKMKEISDITKFTHEIGFYKIPNALFYYSIVQDDEINYSLMLQKTNGISYIDDDGKYKSPEECHAIIIDFLKNNKFDNSKDNVFSFDIGYLIQMYKWVWGKCDIKDDFTKYSCLK
jgi:hypothetical protein